jgi:hypothetical protein
MTTNELYQKLTAAYSVENLNKISLILLDLHKNEQYSVIRKITEIIGEYVKIEISEEGKGFNKLMMLYHPDRAGFHLGEIKRMYQDNNAKALEGYSHILQLERIEEIATTIDCYEDIDYSPVYTWDFEEDEGFSYIDDNETDKWYNTRRTGYTFYDAIKVRVYEDTNIEYPAYYLEDMEEFELSSSNINDLDGVQLCIHAKVIDVSDNRISDITPLSGLTQLEELNLSDNELGYIDALSNLVNMRSIQLCNNNIRDISPLFELENLEYANLSGNRIDRKQIFRLIEAGVTVDF